MAEEMPSGSTGERRVLARGNVYRGSGVLDGLVSKRYAALFSDGFVTYRKDDEKPSKVWALHPDCRVGQLEAKSLIVRRQNTNLLWSLALGRFNEKEMRTFTISWPNKGVTKPSLLLGFELESEARAWHQAFVKAVHAMKRPATKEAKKELKRLKPDKTKAGEGSYWSADGSEPRGGTRSASTSLEDELQPVSAMAGCSGEVADYSDESLPGPDGSAGLGGHRRHNSEGITLYEPPVQVLPDGLPEPDAHWQTWRQSWVPHKLVNGLAVYKEHEDAEGNGGAFMVSGTIRASPEAVYRALINTSHGHTNIWAFSKVAVIKTIDSHVQVLHGIMDPLGWQRNFMRSRDLVVKRTIRYADGIYTVLYQSEDPPTLPPDPNSSLVRATLDAAVFTIAPLKSPRPHMDECMVTLVLRCDLGGNLSRSCWLRSVFGWLETPWLDNLLMTVVALRDRVEQDRFVEKPLDIRMGPMGPSARAAPMDRTLMNKPSAFEAGAASIRAGAQADDLVSPFVEIRNKVGADLRADGALGDLPKPVGAGSGGAGAGAGAGSDDAKEPLLSGTELDAAAKKPAERIRTFLDPRFWSCPGAAGFRVRGDNYLKDRKKVPSLQPVFELQGVELNQTRDFVPHVARYLPVVQRCTKPFLFVLQLTIPWKLLELQGQVLGLVLVFAANYVPEGAANGSGSLVEDDCDSEDLSGFDLNMARFLTGDTAARNNKLKLIPQIVEGSWIIRQAVGTTPVMLGRKLKTTYHQGPGYLECDIDVSTNSTAASVTSMVTGVVKSMVFDMAILLEGQKDDELPERLLGTVRIHRLDLKQATVLDTSKEVESVRETVSTSGPPSRSGSLKALGVPRCDAEAAKMGGTVSMPLPTGSGSGNGYGGRGAQPSFTPLQEARFASSAI